MSDPPRTPDDNPVRYSFLQGCVLVYVIGFLFLFGGLGAGFGVRCVERQQAEFHWKTVQGIGPFAWVKRGTETLQGWEAVRCGLGIVALGTTVMTWGVMCVPSMWNSRTQWRAPRRLSQGLGWVSLIGLVAALVLLFPVWQLWTMSFYLTVLFLIAFGRYLARRPATGRPPPRWVGLAIPGFVLLAISGGWFSRDIPSGMVVGFFATLAVLAHLIEVIPAVRRWADGLRSPPGSGSQPPGEDGPAASPERA